jgi:hypothetical protein
MSENFNKPWAVSQRWRVGRKVGRTVYAQVEAQPSDVDVLIGVMDSPQLAEEAVEAHNACLTCSFINDLPVSLPPAGTEGTT